MTDRVIEAENLRRRYGDVEAVRGVSLEVRRGELFALLGTNGAGKTTTIEILEGLQPGDQVILSDMSTYDEYQRVRLSN